MSNEEEVRTDIVETGILKNEVNFDMALAETKARAQLFKNMLPHIVAVCFQNNIISMGKGDDDKPYITNDGCQKIASTMGISFGKPEIVTSYEDLLQEEDEYYPDGNIKTRGKPPRRAYNVAIFGEAKFMGKQITEFGGATSEQKWFSSSHRSAIEIQQEVMKKALANWHGRCVRNLLGLQGLSWEDLEKVGFKRGAGGSVNFNEGRYSGSDKKDIKSAVVDVKAKIHDQLTEDTKGNNDAYAYVLEGMSYFEIDGKVKKSNDLNKISDKWAMRIWGEMKPGGKKREQYQELVNDALDRYGDIQEEENNESDIPF